MFEIINTFTNKMDSALALLTNIIAGIKNPASTRFLKFQEGEATE